MKKQINYEVSYDVEVTITYTGQKTPSEHHFEIYRTWAELLWDAEKYDVFVTLDEKGEIELDAEGYISDEEISAIKEMMTDMINLDKVKI